MESPRKFNDCYFYYYSTCTKGDNCVFRHEPSALGCETMCSAWQQGKCLDKRCKLRHMELRKNRKQIPCYWETQPGGCRKMHCPFMHKNPEARTDGIAPSQPIPMPPVVLDSSMLGVLPASSELRRMLTPHAHAHAHAHAHGVGHEPAPNPYAPIDPLVVNFEEESDNESAPSSTPTKYRGSESHELLLLEKIQAEAAAYYKYDALPAEHAKERKLVRTNLTTKYDRVSLDEIAGKKQPPQEKRNLDFKILSLDEIRARKSKNDAIIAIPPITLNLRKRKLSTQETVTTAGNKILKVVRSNSVVYKKLDQNAPATSTQAKLGQKQSDSESRKRTFSEQSDVCELQADELEDCYEFKRIKVNEQSTQNKPRLIRNRNTSENKDTHDSIITETIISNADNDSDNEVQIVSVDISNDLSLEKIYDSDIEVDNSKPIEIVDLSDDDENSDIVAADIELVTNVPDVVASCQRSSNRDERSVVSEIDDLLNEL
ncbi:Zinc finger CCCH domain-containing protein 11A [Operophtera brumata]|uniref:Zinc finger CCCH domain-containing protein 11A n=1 Tax=Operophtera brumata TaxID=104452 RepID=A0A0L7KTZ8_OPEBR|nr:Zinc finger CCCH domain-containing protein 11A [Operophtera brumata]